MISIIDETSQKLIEQQIQRLAFIDHLTKVENRLSFNYKITSLINTMSQNEGHFHLIYFDLDQFKSINDEYGHAVGDMVLVEFAKRLVNVTRGEDFIARVGGDEFIMLMENLPSEKHLEHALSRLRVALNLPYQVEDGPLTLSVSLGVSQFPTDGGDAETLLKKADDAMYEEKSNSSA
jgi:diguanylate cyclase (GGDEF)-like protein